MILKVKDWQKLDWKGGETMKTFEEAADVLRLYEGKLSEGDGCITLESTNVREDHYEDSDRVDRRKERFKAEISKRRDGRLSFDIQGQTEGCGRGLPECFSSDDITEELERYGFRRRSDDVQGTLF